MNKDIKFITIFLIVVSILYFIVWEFYSDNLPIIGINNLTYLLNKILNSIGLISILDKDRIYFPNNNSSLTIIKECTGIYEMIILSSIIISYPTNIINKLYGIVFGSIIIYVLNLVRLITIAYVLAYFANSFDFIERYLWQISLVILISISYMIWLKMIESNSSPNSLR